jgi:arylsulfatase A-like enzyme
MALGLAACGGDRSSEPRDGRASPGLGAPLLLVSIDTLPASRVGSYGCPTVRTPVLDRFARRGLQVRDAISPAPLTLPSHATMLTGLEPPEHGVRENGLYTLAPHVRTVPELLPSDTRTGAFVGAFPLTSRFGLARGFAVYDDALSGGRETSRPPERRAAEVFGSAASWIEREAGSRRFAWIHVYDPHYPYAPPEPWNRLARERSDANRFESEVAYTDRELGRFTKRLEALQPTAPATILIVSDHGEALFDHNEPTHGNFIYDATQRVPMILAGPGIEPAIESAMRSLADVAPTLLRAAGVDPPSEWRCASLFEPAKRSWAYIETMSTQLLHGWSPLFGIRTERWKYIRAPRSEVYDLVEDPAERRNVIDREGQVAVELSRELDSFLAGAPKPDEPEADEETLSQLRSLGYVAQVEPGTKHHAEKDPKDQVEVVVALFRGEQAYMEADFARAEGYLRRAIQLDPQNKEAYSFLSGTSFGLGRYDAAVEHARRALTLEPKLNEGPLYVTIGEAYLAMGRPDQAIEPLREGLRLLPGNEKARVLLARAEGRSR